MVKNEKIIKSLEEENAFLRHEIWMDGERLDDLESENQVLRNQLREMEWKTDVLYRMIDSLARRIHAFKEVC